MNDAIQMYFRHLESDDRQLQYEAYQHILSLTEKEVDWAYEVWDQLIKDLDDKDNHKRSRAAQFLSHLAISDPENRMLNDFSALWKVSYDKKFVTARHSLQSIWRVGLAGDQQRKMVVKHLVDRFNGCLDEKNYTLIRFDIIQSLRHLYDALQDDDIRSTAAGLIAKEENEKYQKKYKTVWKNT
ncbi:hypothetical protein [Bacillus paralicheniformis]|uniref:hypothetical protein n=1 Tax=Bacillus paralicheniformis TaxID=1648923 RepID=UPI00128BE2E4|nr:hypothetical protein [Bacillus paralicheniformis]MPQ23606.1 hypothetical protein [Bacillus paralicheniformis]